MSQLSPLQQRKDKFSPHLVTLRLHDIRDLFSMPRHDAFQENYLPLSGIDQIALNMKFARPRYGLHVTLILPVTDNQTTDQQADIQAAIERYCNARLNYLTLELKSRKISTVRSLQGGLVILGISLALAAAITQIEGMADWLRMLLSNTISIFGTVALWSPTDAFLFGLKPLYNDIRVYSAIRDMTFEVQYEQPDSMPVTVNQPIFERGIR